MLPEVSSEWEDRDDHSDRWKVNEKSSAKPVDEDGSEAGGANL